MKINMMLYAFYLFSLVDARFEEHFLTNHAMIWILYTLIAAGENLVFYLGGIRNYGLKIKRRSIGEYQLLIFFFLGLELFNKYTELDEWLYLVCFVVAVFATAAIFLRYHGIFELLMVNFYVPNIAIVMNCIVNKINIIENARTIRISTFFSSNYSYRIRFGLGFTNPNMIGNLSATLILLAIPLLAYLKEHNVHKSVAIGTIAFAAFDILIMLESGSRTAVISIVASGITYVVFFNVSNKKNARLREKMAIATLLGCLLTCCGFIVADKFIATYISSGRVESYQLLETLQGISTLVGNGVFSPGKDGLININGQVFSLHLDNYYSYIFVTTGLTGICVFAIFFIKIYKSMYKRKEEGFIQALLTCFVFDMIYGLAETCILYPQFPSSMMLFTLFLSVANENDAHMIESVTKK